MPMSRRRICSRSMPTISDACCAAISGTLEPWTNRFVSLGFAAAIPVEVLCDLPGIGQLAWKAALGRDLYLLINLTMIVTVITLLANSASDLLGRAFKGEAA